MKQQSAPLPQTSQSQVLRSWFLWTIGGILLCAVFWFFKLEQTHSYSNSQPIEAATSLPVLDPVFQSPEGKFQMNPLKPE